MNRELTRRDESRFFQTISSVSDQNTELILNTFQKAITLLFNVNQYLKDISIANIRSDRDKDYLHQIFDIREEISMVKRVLVQQEEVWKEFALTAFPAFWETGAWSFPRN